MRQDAAARFLSAVFGEHAGEWSRISIFELPSKRASFFNVPDEAAAAASSRCDTQNIYVGVGLYGDVKKGRGTAKDVSAIPALWADVDIGEHDSGKKYPGTIRDAIRVIDLPQASPSIVINSGHGIHAWWLLIEPLTAEDDHIAKAAVWSSVVKNSAARLGYEVDGVGDVSRVLRVPGTFNHKSTPPAAVSVIDWNIDRRYDYDADLGMVIDALGGSNGGSNGGTKGISPILVSSSSFPDARLLDVALDNDPRFKKTWTMRRTDLVDQSPSAYDMALAHWAVSVGWTDQQIADLLVGFRVKHGLELAKAIDRKDYLPRTIEAARASSRRQVTGKVAAAEHSARESTPTTPDGVLSDLRRTVGLSIKRVIKRGSVDARYSIVISCKKAGETEIEIGKAGSLLSLRSFRVSVFDACDHVIGSLSQPVWDSQVRAMMTVAELVDLPDSDHQVVSWLESYLDARPPHGEEEWQRAVVASLPFRRQGVTHVNIGDFRTWLHMACGERAALQDLRASLHRGGWAPKKINARIMGKVVGRWYWQNVLAEPDAGDVDE